VTRFAAAGVVVLISIVALNGAAFAQKEETPAPKLAFVGRTKPVLRLVDGEQLATATVVVANTGNAPAKELTFLLLEDGASAVEACGVQDLASSPAVKKTCDPKAEPVELAAGMSRRFAVTFDVGQPGRAREPLIEARSAVAGVVPALAEMTVSRSLSDRRMWWPFRAAVVAALVFAACGVLATLGAVNRDSSTTSPMKSIWRWATAKIFTAASWNFKDSWATSIAALGGVLGTVLGATGFFTEVLPGVSAGRFTGFSLVFGGLALLAPITYTALSRRDETLSVSVGTVAGLLIASAVTIAAVAGQLMTLGLIVQMSDAPPFFQALCFLGLSLGGGVVVVYAVRSAAWLAKQPPPPAPAGEGTAGSIMATATIPAASGYAVQAAGVP